MKMKFLACSLIALLATPAFAADLFTPNLGVLEDAPSTPWTGVYVGGFGGYAKSSSDVDLGPISIDSLGLDGGLYGAALGADLQLTNRIVIGVFGEYGMTNSDFSVGLGGTSLEVETDDQWSLGARGGVLLTPLTLAYLEGGYSRLSVDDPTFGGSKIPGGAIGDLDGYFIGVGAEYRVSNNVYVGGNVRYTKWDEFGYDLGGSPADDLTFDTDTLQAGLNVKFKLGR